MENIKDLTRNLRNWTFTGEKPVIMDFYATWCGPCKYLSPIVEEIAREYKDRLSVVKVDIDRNQGFAATCGIQSVPTLFFIRKDGTITRMVGVQPKPVVEDMVKRELLSEE